MYCGATPVINAGRTAWVTGGWEVRMSVIQVHGKHGVIFCVTLTIDDCVIDSVQWSGNS